MHGYCPSFHSRLHSLYEANFIAAQIPEQTFEVNVLLFLNTILFDNWLKLSAYMTSFGLSVKKCVVILMVYLYTYT